MHKSLKEFLNVNFDNKNVIDEHNRYVTSAIKEWEAKKIEHYKTVEEINAKDLTTLQGRRDFLTLYYDLRGCTEEVSKILANKIVEDTVAIESYKKDVLKYYSYKTKGLEEDFNYMVNLYRSVLVNDDILEKYVKEETQRCKLLIRNNTVKLQRLRVIKLK